MSRIAGQPRKRVLHIGLAIVFALIAFAGIAYATQPSQIGNGQLPTCSNPQYYITVTASLLWTQGLLGDTVSAQSRQAMITISCPQSFSIAFPWSLFNLYSQNGKFQTVATLTSSGQQIGGAWTGYPTLTAGQATTATIFTAYEGIGSFLLNVQVNEQGCYQFPYVCGSWPFQSVSYSQVGSFSCAFVVTQQTASGSVQNC